MHIDKKQPRLSTKQHTMQNDKRGQCSGVNLQQENPDESEMTLMQEHPKFWPIARVTNMRALALLTLLSVAGSLGKLLIDKSKGKGSHARQAGPRSSDSHHPSPPSNRTKGLPDDAAVAPSGKRRPALSSQETDRLIGDFDFVFVGGEHYSGTSLVEALISSQVRARTFVCLTPLGLPQTLLRVTPSAARAANPAARHARRVRSRARRACAPTCTRTRPRWRRRAKS